MSVKRRTSDRKKRIKKTFHKIKRTFFSKKAVQGSVTVFLVIIMLPMLIFSFSVVDICKIFLGSELTQSAQDLALNSALASYDKVLKDMYGLMASSNTEEELIDKVSEYYVTTLESEGFEVGETGSKIHDLFASLFNSDFENSSYLRLTQSDVPGGNSPITVSPVEVSAISNPDVLEAQIVEYMKYRGPVYLAEGALDKISVFKDLNNQTAAAQSKLTFEKTLSDINNDAIKAYVLFQVYFANCDELETTTGVVNVPYPNEETASRVISKYKADVTANIEFSKWYDEGTFKLESADEAGLAFSALAYGIAGSSYKNNGSLVLKDDVNKLFKTDKITAKEHTDIVTVTNDLNWIAAEYTNFAELDKYRLDFAIEDLEKFAKGESVGSNEGLVNGFNFIESYSLLYKGSDETAVSEELRNLSKFVDDFSQKYIAAVELQKYIKDNPDKVNFSDTQKNALDEAVSNAETDVIAVLQDGIEIFEEKVGHWRDVAQIQYNLCRGKFKELYSTCKKQSEILDQLLNSGAKKRDGLIEKPYGLLNKLYDEFSKAQKDAQAYGENVEKINTETVKTSFNSQYVNEAKDIQALNESDLEALKSVLTKQKKLYDDVLETLDNISYFGTSLGKEILSDNPPTIDAVMAKYAKNGGYKDEISPAGYLNYLFGSSGNYFFETDNIGSWNNSSQKGEITSNEIYKEIAEVGVPKKEDAKKDTSGEQQIKDHAKDATADNVIEQSKGSDGGDSGSSGGSGGSSSDGGSDNKDDFKPTDYKTFDQYLTDLQIEYEKENADKKDTEDKNKDDTEDEGESDDLDSGLNVNKEDNGKVAEGVSKAMGGVGKFFENLAEAELNNLYIAEYLTEDFSCFTTKKAPDFKEDPTSVKTISGQSFYDKDGKSNVVWDDAELEYILYGLDSKDKNIAAAGGVIFSVRFVLNLIYSFTDSEIRAFTRSVATLAAGWLPFAIPIVQTVLHIGLSLAESAYDLGVLLDGGSVPVFKTKTTWVCKGSNIVRKIGAEVVEKAADYVIDKVADKLNEQIEKLGDNITDEAIKKIDGFSDLVTEQVSSIREQVENDIVTPIVDTMNQLIASGEKSAGSFINGIDGSGKFGIKAKIEELKGQLLSSAPLENDIIRQIEQEVLNSFDDSMISSMANAFASNYDSLSQSYSNITGTTFDEVKNKLGSVFSTVENKINSTVDKYKGVVEDKVTEAISKAAKSAQSGVDKGAKKLKASISSSLNQSIRGHEDYNINYSNGDTKAKNYEMISMDYQDYLYIFTILGLHSNKSQMLQRSAIIMCANVRKQSGNSSYDINKACTLFESKASATVRTLFWGTTWDSKGKRWVFPGNNKYTLVRTSYAGY